MVKKYKIVAWAHITRAGKLSDEVAASDIEKYTSTSWQNQTQPYQDVSKQYEAYLEDGYNDNNYWDTVRNQVNNTNQEVFLFFIKSDKRSYYCRSLVYGSPTSSRSKIRIRQCDTFLISGNH